MTDTQHTPGPYRNVDGVIYCGELVIARMCIDRGPRTGDLLAAAPELLASLEDLLANVEGGDFLSLDRIATAHAAIASAKGESK